MGISFLWPTWPKKFVVLQVWLFFLHHLRSATNFLRLSSDRQPVEVYVGRENNLDPTLHRKLGCLTIVTTLSRGVGWGKAFFFSFLKHIVSVKREKCRWVQSPWTNFVPDCRPLCVSFFAVRKCWTIANRTHIDCSPFWVKQSVKASETWKKLKHCFLPVFFFLYSRHYVFRYTTSDLIFFVTDMINSPNFKHFSWKENKSFTWWWVSSLEKRSDWWQVLFPNSFSGVRLTERHYNTGILL